MRLLACARRLAPPALQQKAHAFSSSNTSRAGGCCTAEKNAEESRWAAQALDVYDRLSARRGPDDDALNTAAEGSPMASQPTPPNSAPMKPSERLYEPLSAEAKERVLRELKALQDDPRTTWLKKGEAEKNAEESRAAAQALEVYDRLSTRRGPVDDALNGAAEEIAAGKPANAAKQRAYEAIREVIRQTLAEGQEGRTPGSEGAAGRSENDWLKKGEVRPANT